MNSNLRYSLHQFTRKNRGFQSRRTEFIALSLMIEKRRQPFNFDRHKTHWLFSIFSAAQPEWPVFRGVGCRTLDTAKWATEVAVGHREKRGDPYTEILHKKRNERC